ncbi:hypothetical protein COE15_07640 [Bacillus cereus]|uniref:7-cyano-7-deazaguanine synthase n=1 Tax=Bacillus sp. AFS023182 TaxID=2033492 RepID=UPI000BF458C5|nr:7-cyano-7-deazaguanine synthase [Bacillus sp. AFS023182]PFD96427.1 hypothetical protein CN288_24195 [Bacillus sp. AFS023182]PGY02821.1 hypothetical protein COE15_07640 [Bacillus cereus]
MQSEIEFFSNLHTSLLENVNFDYKEKSTIVIDLVTIMGAIYCKDINTYKTNDKPRFIELTIPVFNLQIWSENVKHIEELVKWVSEDTINITFIDTSVKSEGYMNSLIPGTSNDVTLFSGGLDSFAGAYHNHKNNIKSDYLGFINKGEEKTKQLDVAKFYRQIFDDATEIILIDKPISKKKTFIQSTRSLLYLALATAKAHFNSSKNVYLYENGILSLNPEIKNRYTTKTTHPKTMFMFKALLEKLSINIKINHPFLFRTKGEITNDMNEEFKTAIKHTFTCGQGRSHPERSHSGQCGICIPCVLRKISLAAYDNEKYDVDYEYPYDAKIVNVKEDLYRKDYTSNLNYFKNYYELIKTNQIYFEVHVREKYYEADSNFRMSNQKMFYKFAQEYERFMEKYVPY